jgi:hypothetical protein
MNSTSGVSIEIYNIIGKQIMGVNLGNANGMINERIDISSLPQGIYMVNINAGNELITRKISVVK